MPIPFNDPSRTAGEQEFINQKTRELMVDWCHGAVQGHSLTDDGKPWPQDLEFQIYREFAISKKWISADGSRILSAGI